MSGIERWWKRIWAAIKAAWEVPEPEKPAEKPADTPPVTPPAPPPPQPPVPESPAQPEPAQPPEAPVVPQSPVTAEPKWAAVQLVCKNGEWRLDPGKAAITRALRSAKREGKNLIRMDYDSVRDWPRHSMEGGKWFSWAGVCVAWLDRDVLVTSWFDHIAGEPKPVKDLKNWGNGYVLGGVPGDRQLYIYLISTDGRQRTNMVALA